MIEAYNGKNLSVYFTEKPKIEVRCPEDAQTEEERQDIINKPFLCNTHFWVLLLDHKKSVTYKIEVEEGYTWDGASIPWLAWKVIGAPTNNQFLRASLVHDKMCENKECINFDRSFSTNVFNALLERAGVNKFKRFLMKNSVGCFQTLACNWDLKIDAEKS